MTFPSLAYAGIPYQVFDARLGTAALMREWTFSAIARSESGIFAIAASNSDSPSALAASAFSSRTRARAAAFSAALKPGDTLVCFAGLFVVVVLVGAMV